MRTPQRLASSFSDSRMSVAASIMATTATAMIASWAPAFMPAAAMASATPLPQMTNTCSAPLMAAKMTTVTPRRLAMSYRSSATMMPTSE